MVGFPIEGALATATAELDVLTLVLEEEELTEVDEDDELTDLLEEENILAEADITALAELDTELEELWELDYDD